MKQSRELRKLLKADFVSMKDTVTDQAKGAQMPPIQKELSTNEELIALPQVDSNLSEKENITTCLRERRSRRKLDGGEISLQELSNLLYFTQGVTRLFKRSEDYQVTIRTVPSAGARHPFETYLLINKVKGLKRGIYRYQPIDHQLAYQIDSRYSDEALTAAVNGQSFIAAASVVFIWAAVPYKTEWRYASESSKLILLDAGHVCQNLYIAAESLGLGTCGIAAYDQDKIDNLVGLDGEDEMVVYLAPVGRIPAK